MKTYRLKVATIGLAMSAAAFMGAGCSSMNKTQKGAAIGVGAGGAIGELVKAW